MFSLISKRKKILIGIVLFVVAVVAISLFATKSVADVADAHLTAIRNGDLATAYALTSAQFQASTSLDAFEAFIASSPAMKSHVSASLTSREINGDLGTVKGTLKTTDGSVVPVEFQLVKEGDAWKILSYRIDTGGPVGGEATGAPESATSATGQESQFANLFNEPGYGYTIRYPGDWEYTKPDNLTVLFSGKERTEAYNSTVNIQNWASSAIGGNYDSVDAVVLRLKEQLASAEQVFTTDAEEFDFAAEQGQTVQGKMFGASYSLQGQEAKQFLLVVPRADGRLFYVFSYTSPVNQYDAYASVYRAMLNFWQITAE